MLDTTRLTEKFWDERVRFNLLKDVIEIRKKDSGQWVPHDIEAIAGLYIELGKAHDENPDKTVVIDTIRRMARANEFNPLVDYFEGLRHADADLILVTDQGQVVQQGCHETLMEDLDGPYAQLLQESALDSTSRAQDLNLGILTKHDLKNAHISPRKDQAD